MDSINPDTVFLLLAAGGSRRMGTPKQLLLTEGQPLLVHTLSALAQAGLHQGIVVLGEDAAILTQLCEPFPVISVVNPHWQMGMASSLQCGMAALLTQYPLTQKALISLVDQPLVKAEQYRSLIQASLQVPEKIIAAKYAGQVGAPLLLPATQFPLFSHLKGDQGLRKIIRTRPSLLHSIEMPEAAQDWDTPEDVLQA